MARVEVAIQELSRFGGTAEASYTAGDSTDDMYMLNDGYTLLIVKTGTVTGSPTITIQSVPAPGSGREGDLTDTLESDKEYFFGPFPPSLWNQKGAGEKGRVHIDLVGTMTNVELTAVRLPPSGA